jgi:Spy/CpxP family protein refolding chaperone
MNMNRFAKRAPVAAGFLFLCATPELTRAQSSPPSPAQTPHRASPARRAKRDTGPVDDFAGLKFTDEQNAKIDQIHQDMKSRKDTVAKDEKLSPEQKGAMLDGYRRMERGEILKVLTPEQLTEVRKKVLARRAAEQEAKKKQALPK